ncbi:MAG: hypothetical protein R3178_11480 [Rhodothermales bacterium]|nr:hypothetical protein [Rhodothermales bacterium]
MVAEKKEAGEITDQPLHGNGDSAPDEGEGAKDQGGKKPYRTEEFVRVRRQLTERLDKVKEELARVDAEDMGRRMADWVKENPLLAAALAAGTGILLGRGLISLLSSPEPPPLRERARRRARHISRQAQDLAGDFGASVSEHVADAGDVLLRKAGEARTEVSRKASELSDEIGRRAAEVADAIADSAERASGSTRSAAHSTAEYVREGAGHGRDALESFLGTVRAAAADHVAGKLRDWLHRISR